MNSLVALILSYLLLYKYIVLFIVTYLSALLLPLPSGTLTVAAGAFATEGYFNFPLVISVALAGNVLGDLTGFFVSRKFGRELFENIGLRKMLNSQKFIGLENYIQDKAPLTIFSTRFITSLGPLVNIFAGLSDMSFRRFFPYEFLGEFFDVMMLASVGYIVGDQWQSAAGLTGVIITAIALTLCVYLFGRSYFKALHHKK